MTIGGALSELDNLLKADNIPCYYKPSIKAVMDTIALEQEPTIKNDLGVDAVSRKAVDDALYDFWHDVNIVNFSGLGVYQYSIDVINELTSVTPIRPKGHWICVGKVEVLRIIIVQNVGLN